MKNRKITLISNDQAVISSLRGALKMSDFSYEIISNKEDALIKKLLMTDVLIIDDSNPLQTNPLDLCKQIRDHTKEIIVILLVEAVD